MADTLGNQVVRRLGHTLSTGRHSPAIPVPPEGIRRTLFLSEQVSNDAEGRVIGVGDAALWTTVWSRLPGDSVRAGTPAQIARLAEERYPVEISGVAVTGEKQ
ncbi:hypothetical protein [Streptomyces sp. GbtcB6]|uniref:hypothetical protein n=1 Tax=Streptomyces sp. GbtcB6 TaxID=2824751 RepID=UPI001C2F132C|nr:hypothetical protein [Streptomyces sp. GbtcB6]